MGRGFDLGPGLYFETEYTAMPAKREKKMLNGLTSKEMVFMTALHATAKVNLPAAKEMATKWLRSAKSQTARSRRRSAMQTVKHLFS